MMAAYILTVHGLLVIVHRCMENGDELSSGLGDVFPRQISHMASSHIEFFTQWFGLLAEEEQCCRAKQRTAPWLSTAHDRYALPMAVYCT